MDEDHALWRLECDLWLGGAEAYQRALDPACLMAFPAAGVINGAAAILRSLEGAPRWDAVETDDRQLARSTDAIAVLAYRARALRRGAEPYEAWCTSTWRRDGAGWRLVQHQQTPV